MSKVTVKKVKDRNLIITIDASEYGIDTTGEKDSTAAIQKAIDDCQAAGGGTVFLPAGRYALCEELVIRTSVMLHGEGEERTIINCLYGKGTERGMQICMEACTGLLDITLYHPEQDMKNPVPYPPTVRQHGSNSITVERVSFVNPWVGIQCGPDANELHFIRNVKISPLYQGIYMDMTTDIGRIQGLFISPVWYREFIRLEYGAEPEQAEELAGTAEKYMLSHATGIYMARSDWEYGYDITIEGCRTGLVITSAQDIGPNAQISRLKIRGCEIGIRLHCGNPYGIAITDSLIAAGEKKRKAAIKCDDSFVSVLQCCDVTIEGEYEHLILQEGDGQLSFVECRFEGKGGKEDILQKAGGLSLLNTLFASGGIHVKIQDGAGGTQIVGSISVAADRMQEPHKEGEKLTISVAKSVEDNLLYNQEKLPIPYKKCNGYQKYPYSAEPEKSDLYIVTQYGACGDGIADDTEAFLRALHDAGESGGYVYVPGGKYRITMPLVIPEGVELRGTAEVPCHTMGGGSVLLISCGHGQEEGQPFLTLSGKCGIRGIVLHHPEQDPVTPVVYPWAVRSVGDSCYVIDTVFVNAWKGIDFGTVGGKDHYISYVSGAPIRCGIFVGNNPGDVWIENVQYNPHYWYRCSLPGRPGDDTWVEFWHNQIKYLDAFRYGANESLHVLNTFVFAARNGVRFIKQDGKGTKGTVIGHGTDGGECGICIEGLENVEFVNTELVTIESPNRRIYLRNSGEGAVFYNTLMWGAPHTAILVEDGCLKMIQTNIVDSGETAIVVEEGAADIAATYFYRRSKQLKVNGGKVKYLANMTVKEYGNAGEALPPVEIAKNGGTVIEAFNWHK